MITPNATTYCSFSWMVKCHSLAEVGRTDCLYLRTRFNFFSSFFLFFYMKRLLVLFFEEICSLLSLKVENSVI